MGTRSRIGLKLQDGSIISAYHHWDGYPEWLGVTLKEHYNTKEKIAELIDGGNMSSCYSDNEFDYDKQEFVKRCFATSYYGGDDEAPRIDKNFADYAQNATAGEEFLYVFDENMWKGFSIEHKYDENYYMIDFTCKPVVIPEPEDS